MFCIFCTTLTSGMMYAFTKRIMYILQKCKIRKKRTIIKSFFFWCRRSGVATRSFVKHYFVMLRLKLRLLLIPKNLFILKIFLGALNIIFDSSRSYKKKEIAKNYLFFLVPPVGIEPTRYRYRGILSPVRLPVSPRRHF